MAARTADVEKYVEMTSLSTYLLKANRMELFTRKVGYCSDVG